MADERYNLPYTGATVEQLLAAIANIVVPTKVSDLTNDSGFITNAALPTKVSDLTLHGEYGRPGLIFVGTAVI